MIYLFEDRKGRMESYFRDNLDSDLIKQVTIDCEKSKLIEYLKSNFSSATAVIFHLSYSFSDKSISNEDVRGFFVKQKTPFVYFSGGLNSSLVIENDLVNGNVNSGDMYNNISAFLEDFQSRDVVNIPLLVNGQGYLLNSLLELQSIITLYLFDKRNDDYLTKENLDEIIDLVDARFKEEELTTAREKLVRWLNNKNSKETVTVKKQVLLSQIQRMNDKILKLL